MKIAIKLKEFIVTSIREAIAVENYQGVDYKRAEIIRWLRNRTGMGLREAADITNSLSYGETQYIDNYHTGGVDTIPDTLEWEVVAGQEQPIKTRTISVHLKTPFGDITTSMPWDERDRAYIMLEQYTNDGKSATISVEQ